MKKDLAEVIENVTYHLRGITYVPHYRNKNVFVAPGYPNKNSNIYSMMELMEAGAQKRVRMLWQRGEYGVITPGNP